MAEEIVVVCPTGYGHGPMGNERKWNGAAAGAFISDTNIKGGQILIVTAENVAEAIKGVKQLYPAYCAQKLIGVKKSAVTEE